MKLQYYTKSQCEKLEANILGHSEWYSGTSQSRSPLPNVPPESVRESELEVEDYLHLLDITSTTNQADINNSLLVYDKLECLTRHQASDPRLWIYEAHRCRTYTYERWKRSLTADILETQQKGIKAHYFASNIRSMLRSNSISRLWWAGYIARQVAPDNPRRFLEVLFKTQDIRQQLIERPSLASNFDVLRVIYKVLNKNDLENNGTLFKKNVFIMWMKQVNSIGGYVILDSLSIESLESLLVEEANEALRQERLSAEK